MQAGVQERHGSLSRLSVVWHGKVQSQDACLPTGKAHCLSHYCLMDVHKNEEPSHHHKHKAHGGREGGGRK